MASKSSLPSWGLPEALVCGSPSLSSSDSASSRGPFLRSLTVRPGCGHPSWAGLGVPPSLLGLQDEELHFWAFLLFHLLPAPHTPFPPGLLPCGFVKCKLKSEVTAVVFKKHPESLNVCYWWGESGTRVGSRGPEPPTQWLKPRAYPGGLHEMCRWHSSPAQSALATWKTVGSCLVHLHELACRFLLSNSTTFWVPHSAAHSAHFHSDRVPLRCEVASSRQSYCLAWPEVVPEAPPLQCLSHSLRK